MCETYWCIWCNRELPIVDGVVIHDNVEHVPTANEIAAAYEERLATLRQQLAEAKKDAERWRLFVELFRAVERQRNIDVLQGISSGIRSEAK
jgi:hypothetical protein